MSRISGNICTCEKAPVAPGLFFLRIWFVAQTILINFKTTIMQNIRFRGPHLGILAVVFTALFIIGLSFVITFTPGAPHYRNPYDAAPRVTAYFREHPHDVLMCMFFQFLSAIPFGLFTVTAFNRLKFLGVKAVGPSIALLGGLLVSFTMMVSSMIGWTMVFPGIASDDGALRALYYLGFALGGVGY